MKHLLFLFFLLLVVSCKKDPKVNPETANTVTGPGEITSSREFDADQDGRTDFLISINPAPHSEATISIQNLRDDVILEASLQNDTTFIHHQSNIPDQTKKERFLVRTLCCRRRHVLDSVASVAKGVAHLVIHDDYTQIPASPSFHGGTFWLKNIPAGAIIEATYTSGDSTFHNVRTYDMNCDKLPGPDAFSYIAFQSAGGHQGWLKLRIIKEGHAVEIAQIFTR
jgi:hypothetical protein